MARGLVIGKFMPLHLGHIKLIRFAAEKCRDVTVLLCARNEEPIPGPVRLGWLWETFRDDPRVNIACTDRELPDSISSLREMPRVWASYLSVRFPDARTIVSSEDYGESLAEYMGIDHIVFDPERSDVPISASMIRMSPYEY
jgi:HTH-type transcriptional repressor of NAD biosynthesis genes